MVDTKRILLETDLTEHELSHICKFGLTPLQGRVYVSLVRHGPSQARTLASNMGVNRVDVYRILRELRNRGIVEVQLTEPSKFAATPPKMALELLVSERESQVAELRQIVPWLSAWLDSIANTEVGCDTSNTENTAVSHFKLKYGNQYLETLESMVRNSKQEILKIWSAPGITLHSREGLLEEFSSAASRGVKIRGIIEITKEIMKEIRSVNRYAELRHSDHLSSALRYTISDCREVFVSGTSVPLVGRELVGFWTNNISVVRGFVQDFERLWNGSLPLAEATRETNASPIV